MDYFNTNQETGATLENSIAAARRQQERILAIFRYFAGSCFSPEEIHKVFSQNVPLTSIRRAITNLTKAGKLEKTPHMTFGKYGKKVHMWRYAGD